MASASTYGNTRDFVRDTIGAGRCSLADSQWNTVLSDCLIQMWSDLADDDFYCRTFPINLLNGVCVYDLPEELHSIEDVTDPATCASLMPVGRPCKVDPTPEDNSDPCPPEQNRWRGKNSPTQTEIPKATKPKGFFIEKGQVWFDPVPVIPDGQTCIIEIRGQVKPVCRFWTDELVNGKMIRTWLPIDLPAEFQAIFNKCVLGLAYALCDDPGTSEYWLRLASAEMRSVLERRNRSGYVESNPTKDTFRIGSDRRHSCIGDSFRCVPPQSYIEKVNTCPC